MDCLTKVDLFSVSVRCPKCNMAMNNMRVSSNPKYAYTCITCKENFYPSQCNNTVIDYFDTDKNEFNLVWEITLHNKDSEWYMKKRNILSKICKKYNISFLRCDNADKDSIFVDFGWKYQPSVETIQQFTNEVIKIL